MKRGQRTGMEHAAKHCGIRRIVQVRVGEYDKGTRAAKLERDGFDVAPTEFGEDGTYACRACEVHFPVAISITYLNPDDIRLTRQPGAQ